MREVCHAQRQHCCSTATARMTTNKQMHPPAIPRLYLQCILATLQPKEACRRSTCQWLRHLPPCCPREECEGSAWAPSSPQKVPQELRMRQKGVPVPGSSPHPTTSTSWSTCAIGTLCNDWCAGGWLVLMCLHVYMRTDELEIGKAAHAAGTPRMEGSRCLSQCRPGGQTQRWAESPWSR
jgi:hypothetical protein